MWIVGVYYPELFRVGVTIHLALYTAIVAILSRKVIREHDEHASSA
jgi:hypothetical protein